MTIRKEYVLHQNGNIYYRSRSECSVDYYNPYNTTVLDMENPTYSKLENITMLISESDIIMAATSPEFLIGKITLENIMYEYEELIPYFNSGTFPPMFSQWGMINPDGENIAVSFIQHNLLPNYFKDWDKLAYPEKVGSRTLAHEYIKQYGVFPKTIMVQHYLLKDGNGVTLFDELMARERNLTLENISLSNMENPPYKQLIDIRYFINKVMIKELRSNTEEIKKLSIRCGKLDSNQIIRSTMAHVKKQADKSIKIQKMYDDILELIECHTDIDNFF